MHTQYDDIDFLLRKRELLRVSCLMPPPSNLHHAHTATQSIFIDFG
jgi:hypothetical protein